MNSIVPEYLFLLAAGVWTLLLNILDFPLPMLSFMFIHRLGGHFLSWLGYEMTGPWRRMYLLFSDIPGGQLPLQHILHGVCLKSNDLAAKKHFQILRFLLLSVIVLLFQKYQSKCVSSVRFYLFLWQMQHSTFWDGLLLYIFLNRSFKRNVFIFGDTSICEWTCTILRNIFVS